MKPLFKKNMNRFLFLWTFLCLMGLLTGCDQTKLDLQLPPPSLKLAVTSTFSPDKEWKVYVSKTQSIQDASLGSEITNANVEIFEEGKFSAKLLHQGYGEYTARGIKPIIGKVYTLKVSAPNYPSVTATSSIPEPVTIQKAVFKDGSQGISYSVTFQDLTAQKDYYEIGSVAYLDAQGKYETFQYANSDDISIKENEILAYILNDPESRNQFSDDRFDGQPYTIDFGGGRFDVYAYFARLFHLSADLYKYKESIRIYQRNASRPFAEPSRIYSNIEGGVGIFAGYSFSDSPKTILDELNPNKIAGTYKSSEFKLSRKDKEYDIQIGGGNVTYTLNADFSMKGEYLIPANANPDQGSEVRKSFEGTWRIEGNLIFITPDPMLEANIDSSVNRFWGYRQGTLQKVYNYTGGNGISVKMEK
jgi:hypothetical protein